MNCNGNSVGHTLPWSKCARLHRTYPLVSNSTGNSHLLLTSTLRIDRSHVDHPNSKQDTIKPPLWYKSSSNARRHLYTLDCNPFAGRTLENDKTHNDDKNEVGFDLVLNDKQYTELLSRTNNSYIADWIQRVPQADMQRTSKKQLYKLPHNTYVAAHPPEWTVHNDYTVNLDTRRSKSHKHHSPVLLQSYIDDTKAQAGIRAPPYCDVFYDICYKQLQTGPGSRHHIFCTSSLEHRVYIFLQEAPSLIHIKDILSYVADPSEHTQLENVS